MGANKYKTVNSLLKADARRLNNVTYAGFSVLMAACANEDSDPKVVKMILNLYNRVEDPSLNCDINYRMRSRTMKWKLLRSTAKILTRVGVSGSALFERIAHGAGLTALHYAARRGDTEIVKLLLEAGADPNIESEMGLDAFQICEKYGPFPRVNEMMAARPDTSMNMR